VQEHSLGAREFGGIEGADHRCQVGTGRRWDVHDVRERLADEARARAAVIPQDRWRGARGSHRRPCAIRAEQDVYSAPRRNARESGGGRGVGVRDRKVNSGLRRP
jgi:hypothetical protein